MCAIGPDSLQIQCWRLVLTNTFVFFSHLAFVELAPAWPLSCPLLTYFSTFLITSSIR